MRKDRFIVGLIVLAIALWVFISDSGTNTAPPATALIVLGIIMIAISRRG